MKTFFTLVALFFLSVSGLVHSAQHAVILQYHHVAEDTPAITSISPQQFSAHLDFLEQQGFVIADLPTVIESLQQNRPLADKTVAITFDDGYKNLLSHAIPELNKRNFPYTIFVNPGLIANGTELYLSWDDLTELAKQGATIANHGWQHDYWVRQPENVTTAVWQARIKQQILRSENEITKRTGQNHKMLAYPYGEYTTWLLEWLDEQGFTAFGQHSGAISASSHWQALPRFPANGIYANLNTLKVKLLSLPMPVKAITPLNPVVDKHNPPELVIELAVNDDMLVSQLACFVSGQSQPLVTWLDETRFSVLASKPLSQGRNRYNCTAPSKALSGRYYWFSQPWLLTNRH